jgi:ribosome-associated protein
MDIRAKQRAVVEALEDVKGRDIVVFDVAKQTAYFERVIIASGDSSRQVGALANAVQEKLKALGAHIVGVEGRRNGEWVLVDLGDIVVHVMHPAVRSHYNLEELWGEKEVKLGKAAAPARKPKAKSKPKPRPRKRTPAPKARARAKTARPRRR